MKNYDTRPKRKKKKPQSMSDEATYYYLHIHIYDIFFIKILIFYSRLGYLMKSSQKIYKIIYELIIENVFNKLYEW